MKRFMKNNSMILYRMCLLVLAVFGMDMTAWANSVSLSVPYNFTSGSVIRSGEVNANFNTLANAMPAVKEVRSTGQILLTNSLQNILSLTVTPPVSGYILLTGAGLFNYNKTVGGTVETALVYLTTTSAGTSNVKTEFYNSSGIALGYVFFPFNVTGVFPVIGGVATTFYMTAEHWSANASDTMNIGWGSGDTSLTALFVPNALP